MARCTSCKSFVSSKDWVCPRCDAPPPKASKAMGVPAVCLFLASLAAPVAVVSYLAWSGPLFWSLTAVVR